MKLEEQFLQKPSENYLPLMSTGSRINELSVDAEGVLNADFSSEFINNMNLGSGYEQLVLQSLADTLGGYFGVSKVRITIDGRPYESGHISMDLIEVSQ
jgi:spore germination protein GerM